MTRLSLSQLNPPLSRSYSKAVSPEKRICRSEIDPSEAKETTSSNLSRSTSPIDCCTSVDSSFAVSSNLLVSDADQAQPVSTCLDTLSQKIFSSSTNGVTLEEQVVLDCSSSTANAGFSAYQKNIEPARNWEYCF